MVGTVQNLYCKGDNMNLDKHPILWQGYNVVQQIEKCGASPELTRAVIMAGELNDNVEFLVDQLIELREAIEPFVNIVKTSNGRIPVEKLSAAEWHRMCESFQFSDIVGKLNK